MVIRPGTPAGGPEPGLLIEDPQGEFFEPEGAKEVHASHAILSPADGRLAPLHAGQLDLDHRP